MVWSGAMLAPVEVLRYGHDKARDHAAGVILSQSLENDNKAAINVLSAMPLLLHLFTRPSETIYHLWTLGMNRKKVVKCSNGGVCGEGGWRGGVGGDDGGVSARRMRGGAHDIDERQHDGRHC